MSEDNKTNPVKMPPNINFNAYVLLTKLTEEDIIRFTGMLV